MYRKWNFFLKEEVDLLEDQLVFSNDFFAFYTNSVFEEELKYIVSETIFRGDDVSKKIFKLKDIIIEGEIFHKKNLGFLSLVFFRLYIVCAFLILVRQSFLFFVDIQGMLYVFLDCLSVFFSFVCSAFFYKIIKVHEPSYWFCSDRISLKGYRFLRFLFLSENLEDKIFLEKAKRCQFSGCDLKKNNEQMLDYWLRYEDCDSKTTQRKYQDYLVLYEIMGFFVLVFFYLFIPIYAFFVDRI